MRDYILLYINGKPVEIRGQQAFLPLSEYLRYELQLTGTKIVCAEGDCGACTVLAGPPFQPINSCIQFVYLLDGSHIITVEGIAGQQALNPIQQAMIENFGAQCGYCTPGFICAMAGLFEEKTEITEKNIRNALTGNLCRCTGYQPIIDAALSIDTRSYQKLAAKFPEVPDPKIIATPVLIESEGRTIYIPTTLNDLFAFRKVHKKTTLVSGATDLGVQTNKQKIDPIIHISLNRIDELYQIEQRTEQGEDWIRVGAKVSLTKLAKTMEEPIPEFSRLLNVFASPQIKNVGTLAGNVANASPIGDTLPFLFVTDAEVELAGPTGTRRININQFYKGYRTTVMHDDEIIVAIHLPVPPKDHFLKLYKITKRKDLDISVVTAAFYGKICDGKIERINVAYGGVAATVLRMPVLEQNLSGHPFQLKTFQDAKQWIRSVIKPLSDVRGSQEYRYLLAENILEKLYYDL